MFIDKFQHQIKNEIKKMKRSAKEFFKILKYIVNGTK